MPIYGYEEIDKYDEENYKYLDKIDFIPYLEKYDTIEELYRAVEDDYDGMSFSNNDFLRGCVFNYIDDYDVQLYLENRYDIKCKTEFYERTWIPKGVKYVERDEYRA
jgi:hypothetical protein